MHGKCTLQIRGKIDIDAWIVLCLKRLLFFLLKLTVFCFHADWSARRTPCHSEPRFIGVKNLSLSNDWDSSLRSEWRRVKRGAKWTGCRIPPSHEATEDRQVRHDNSLRSEWHVGAWNDKIIYELINKSLKANTRLRAVSLSFLLLFWRVFFQSVPQSRL